ncbi:MAG: flagellin lysine-N-methylase [Aristaeellaceae bacterium]
MQMIAPDYYSHFRCVAGDCRHTCCRGWEIDVDNVALARYAQVEGALGDKLRRVIDQSGDTAHFRLDAQENCPFLQADGLCELICTLGEDSLCQVCADHPRYRGFFTDRTEVGLGLCCEAAARLILTWPEPVRLITLTDDGMNDTLTRDEEALLSLREKVMDMVQNRSRPLADRVAALEAMSGIPLPESSLPGWADMLLTLERLDEAWTLRLQALRDAPPSTGLDAAWDTPMEQLLVYLLYRHLTGALEDGDVSGRLAFAVLSWKLIRALFLLEAEQTMDTLVETARLWSSEMEYSDENIGAMLDALDEEMME